MLPHLPRPWPPTMEPANVSFFLQTPVQTWGCLGPVSDRSRRKPHLFYPEEGVFHTASSSTGSSQVAPAPRLSEPTPTSVNTGLSEPSRGLTVVVRTGSMGSHSFPHGGPPSPQTHTDIFPIKKDQGLGSGAKSPFQTAPRFPEKQGSKERGTPWE